MNKKFRLSVVLLSSLAASLGVFSLVNKSVEKSEAAASSVIEQYYQSIGKNDRGDTLLEKLRTLNNTKLTFHVPYNSMSSYFSRTDTYNGSLRSFYSGNPIRGNSYTREHVWPDSHGGNLVENDIHMVRPCLSSENTSRGNSFYVEGMETEYDGWDPAMPSWGDSTYRGDAARIIFYCVVANRNLSLLDESYHYTTSEDNDNMMGKLSDMIRWHLLNKAKPRENTRNDAAQSIQGNRNPFIDHPEYVCRIWGNTNETTDAICKQYDPYYEGATLEGISLDVSNVTMTVRTYHQLNLTFNPSDAYNKNVKWESNNTSVVAVADSTGKLYARNVGSAYVTVTSEESNYTATCYVTVTNAAPSGGGSSSSCGGNIYFTSSVLAIVSAGTLALLLILKKKLKQK